MGCHVEISQINKQMNEIRLLARKALTMPYMSCWEMPAPSWARAYINEAALGMPVQLQQGGTASFCIKTFTKEREIEKNTHSRLYNVVSSENSGKHNFFINLIKYNYT